MAQHLLNEVSHHCVKTTHTETVKSNIIAWRSLSATRRNMPRPPSGLVNTTRRQSLPDPLLQVSRLVGSILSPGATRCWASLLVLLPGCLSMPPDAIPVDHSCWFFDTRNWYILHSGLLEKWHCTLVSQNM